MVLENLGKTFLGPKGVRQQAVQDLNLTLEEGERLVLAGPSGCGKTTTLRLIAGLEKPDTGTISIDGRVMNRVPPGDRDVAMVFQHHALFPHLTVFDNLALGLTLRGVAPAEKQRRVGEVAGMLGLEHCLDRRPASLSGGECQRVALGRAMVRRPRLFLFDEPLSNLDLPLRARLRRDFVEVQRQLGISTLFVTHDQAEAMALGDRLAVMNQGRVQQVATPSQVYHLPANLFVAGFLGWPPMNRWRGVIAPGGGRLYFENPRPPGQSAEVRLRVDATQVSKLVAYVDREVILGLRAEHIAPAEPASEPDLHAKLQLVEPFGAESHLHLTAGPYPLIASWRGHTVRSLPDELLRLRLDMARARYFDPGNGIAIA